MTEKAEIPTKEELLEGGAVEETPQKAEYTDLEKRAMSRGWKPKDQWEGDPEDWRSAREHVERGEMIGKIMSQDRELGDLKKAVQFMTEQHRKEFVKGYQKAVEELKAQRDAALEDGNLRVVQQLNDKIGEVKEQFQEVRRSAEVRPPQEPVVSDDFRRWNADNNWYGQDKVLTRYADSVGVAFKEENRNSTELEMLAHVAEVVKRDMKHKFQPDHAPNPDGGGRTVSRQRAQDSQSASAIERNMTDEQRSIMKTVLKVTPKMTKEQYLKKFIE